MTAVRLTRDEALSWLTAAKWPRGEPAGAGRSDQKGSGVVMRCLFSLRSMPERDAAEILAWLFYGRAPMGIA